MDIERIKTIELLPNERADIAANNRFNLSFVLYMRDSNTMCINAEHPEADRIEQIITDIWPCSELSEQTSTGKTVIDTLGELMTIGGIDAESYLLTVWNRKNDRERAKTTRDRAKEWYHLNSPDIALLTADKGKMEAIDELYKEVKRAHRIGGHADALAAVFQYGYKMAQEAQQPTV